MHASAWTQLEFYPSWAQLEVTVLAGERGTRHPGALLMGYCRLWRSKLLTCGSACKHISSSEQRGPGSQTHNGTCTRVGAAWGRMAKSALVLGPVMPRHVLWCCWDLVPGGWRCHVGVRTVCNPGMIWWGHSSGITVASVLVWKTEWAAVLRGRGQDIKWCERQQRLPIACVDVGLCSWNGAPPVQHWRALLQHPEFEFWSETFCSQRLADRSYQTGFEKTCNF